MNLTIILIIICCFALIIGAAITLIHSAKKFKLSAKQQQDIKEREIAQQKKDDALK